MPNMIFLRRILPRQLTTCCLMTVIIGCLLTAAHSGCVVAAAERTAVSGISAGTHHDAGPVRESGEVGRAERPDWSMVVLSGYCVLILGASLLGGWLPSVIRVTHTRMQIVVSFVGGLMLGIAVFHLIPHASAVLVIDRVMLWMMAGILFMFFLIRTFHFHNHGLAEDGHEQRCVPCDQDHEHTHAHGHSHPHRLNLSWVGILAGLSIHTLLDGIALAGSVAASSGSDRLLPGIAVFVAIVLHKPLDAVSITSLMAAGGWTSRGMQAVNAGFALMCPLGVVLFLAGLQQFPGLHDELSGAAMAFSAGIFLCVALSDLLPEMEFHSHHRIYLSVALLLGIATAWVTGFLEPGHVH